MHSECERKMVDLCVHLKSISNQITSPPADQCGLWFIHLVFVHSFGVCLQKMNITMTTEACSQRAVGQGHIAWPMNPLEDHLIIWANVCVIP